MWHFILVQNPVIWLFHIILILQRLMKQELSSTWEDNIWCKGCFFFFSMNVINNLLYELTRKKKSINNDVCLFFCPDLSSGESEEEERVCGMSGEKVRLGKKIFVPVFFIPFPNLLVYLCICLSLCDFYTLFSHYSPLRWY